MIIGPAGVKQHLLHILDDWSDDTFDFLRHQVPRIVAVLIIAFILTRLLKAAATSSQRTKQESRGALGFARATTSHSLQRDL